MFNLDRPTNDIVKVRCKLGLSQSAFAAALGISLDTLQNWEQGRREPTGPAKVLLRIAACLDYARDLATFEAVAA